MKLTFLDVLFLIIATFVLVIYMTGKITYFEGFVMLSLIFIQAKLAEKKGA